MTQPLPFSLSQNLKNVAPFLAMDVMAKAKARTNQGDDILHMEVGEPSASTPALIREAAIEAIKNENISYTQALGLPELREKIAKHYHDTYHINIPMERIVITTGSSAGFVLSFLALFNQGDRVAISSPGYPAYRNILAALALEPVLIDAGESENWQMSAHNILKVHREKPLNGVLVMSPANPTGAMACEKTLSELAQLCRNINIPLISDEIYHGLTYGERQTCLLEKEPAALIINSFSKYYAMTGWRIGWMVVPDFMIRPIERLIQNLFISAPYISQKAALAAFDATDELETIRCGYAKNRQYLLNTLPNVGFNRLAPADGAFYIYADISKLSHNSIGFCKKMLDEIGVAATSGVDFDPINGHRFMRFSYAGSFNTCTQLIARLKNWKLK